VTLRSMVDREMGFAHATTALAEPPPGAAPGERRSMSNANAAFADGQGIAAKAGTVQGG